MKSVRKVLLVDDQKVTHRLLRDLLKAHSELEIVGAAETVDEAAALAAAHRPDLIFLDVQLANETGFDLLPRLDYAPHVIFVTGHSRHAARAFEVDAIDYLLKPVTPDRLDAALARLRLRAAPPVPAPAPMPAAPPAPFRQDDIVIQREAGRLHVIPVEKIAAVISEGNFSRLYLRTGENLFLRRLIGEWEDQLPPAAFLRVDRTTIFNLGLIREVATMSRDLSVVQVEGVESKFEMGRAGSARLRAALRNLGR